jgi:hypothetical protein
MGFIFLKNIQLIEEDTISCFIMLNMRVENKMVGRESNTEFTSQKLHM